MSYTKHDWADDTTPPLSGTNLLDIDSALETAINNSADKRDFTIKGDLLVGLSNGSNSILGGEADAYVVLRGDLGFSLGVRWSSLLLDSLMTTGSIIFSGGGAELSQDNSNFFWNNADGRLGVGSLVPLKDLSFGGQATRYIGIDRATTEDLPGKDLIIQAGGAFLGGTNLNGGDLMLSSGMSTGNSSGANVYFRTTFSNTGGTADNTKITKIVIPHGGGITLYGETSGTIKIGVPASAGSNTITFLAETATLMTTASKAAYTDINTGSNDTLYATALGVKSSNLSKRTLILKIFDDTTLPTTGTGKLYFMLPAELNGYNLVDAQSFVYIASTSGILTTQLTTYVRAGSVVTANCVLSIASSIDINEVSSSTAAIPSRIDVDYDDVQTGDIWRVDVMTAGSSATRGLGLVLTFARP